MFTFPAGFFFAFRHIRRQPSSEMKPPGRIELDVGDMRVGDKIKVRDLAIASDKDVQLQTDLDTVVVEVYASKNTAADEDAEDGGSEAEGK